MIHEPVTAQPDPSNPRNSTYHPLANPLTSTISIGLLPRPATFSTFERIAACFAGIAVGDAVGKQTEMLAHVQVSQWYPLGVRGFEGTPGTIIPRYAGNSKREWLIGETTDDTERTIAVANAIIADRLVSHVSIGREKLSGV